MGNETMPLLYFEAMIAALAAILLSLRDFGVSGSGPRFGLRELFAWMTLMSIATAAAAMLDRNPFERIESSQQLVIPPAATAHPHPG
jgi:hypothetical protein